MLFVNPPGRVQMPVISKQDRLATLINVFNVAPTDQDRLLDILTAATQSVVRHAPGFVSAALHRSVDGTKVTMYAQWRSLEDYEQMRSNPEASAYLQQALAMARLDPGMYEVAETFSPGGAEGG
jgi:quinol monooxygenase YgiN